MDADAVRQRVDGIMFCIRCTQRLSIELSFPNIPREGTMRSRRAIFGFSDQVPTADTCCGACDRKAARAACVSELLHRNKRIQSSLALLPFTLVNEVLLSAVRSCMPPEVVLLPQGTSAGWRCFDGEPREFPMRKPTGAIGAQSADFEVFSGSAKRICAWWYSGQRCVVWYDNR